MEAAGPGVTRVLVEIGPIGRVRPYRAAVERVPVLQVYVSRVAVDWLGLDELAENLIFAGSARTASVALVKPGHRLARRPARQPSTRLSKRTRRCEPA